MYLFLHIRLWHCLSIHFSWLIKLWQSFTPATQLLTFCLQPFSSMLLFCLPGLLFPSGLHSNTVTQCSSSLYIYVLSNSIFSVWSHHLLCLLNVTFRICRCEMVWDHFILSTCMCFMHLYWKASVFFNFQASQPYLKTVLTIVLNN